MKQSICFAYYADGKWIGWYADSSGSVRDWPKVYGFTEPQMDIVKENFRHKIKEINIESYKQNHEKFMEKQKNNELGPGEAIHQVAKLALHDSEKLLTGKDVELRIVECPIYDGPNPDFDKEAYTKDMLEYVNKMKEEGIFNIPAPSAARRAAIEEFGSRNPRPKCNNWIYAKFEEIKEWAKTEPVHFIGVIKP